VPEYKRIADSFEYGNSDIAVGAMDVWYDEPFYDRLNITHFPTVKLYGRDKSLPITCFNDSDYITLELVRKFVFEYLDSVETDVSEDFFDTDEDVTIAAWESSTQTEYEGSGVWEYSTQNEDDYTELWATPESTIERQQKLVVNSSYGIWEFSTPTEEEALEILESTTQTEDATTELWTSSERTTERQQRLAVNSSYSDWEFSTKTEEEALEILESSTQTTEHWTTPESTTERQQILAVNSSYSDWEFSIQTGNTTELWNSSETTTERQQRVAVNSASSDRNLASVFVFFIILNMFASYNS